MKPEWQLRRKGLGWPGAPASLNPGLRERSCDERGARPGRTADGRGFPWHCVAPIATACVPSPGTRTDTPQSAISSPRVPPRSATRPRYSLHPIRSGMNHADPLELSSRLAYRALAPNRRIPIIPNSLRPTLAHGTGYNSQPARQHFKASRYSPHDRLPPHQSAIRKLTAPRGYQLLTPLTSTYSAHSTCPPHLPQSLSRPAYSNLLSTHLLTFSSLAPLFSNSIGAVSWSSGTVYSHRLPS